MPGKLKETKKDYQLRTSQAQAVANQSHHIVNEKEQKKSGKKENIPQIENSQAKAAVHHQLMTNYQDIADKSKSSAQNSQLQETADNSNSQIITRSRSGAIDNGKSSDQNSQLQQTADNSSSQTTTRSRSDATTSRNTGRSRQGAISIPSSGQKQSSFSAENISGESEGGVIDAGKNVLDTASGSAGEIGLKALSGNLIEMTALHEGVKVEDLTSEHYDDDTKGFLNTTETVEDSIAFLKVFSGTYSLYKLCRNAKKWKSEDGGYKKIVKGVEETFEGAEGTLGVIEFSKDLKNEMDGGEDEFTTTGAGTGLEASAATGLDIPIGILGGLKDAFAAFRNTAEIFEKINELVEAEKNADKDKAKELRAEIAQKYVDANIEILNCIKKFEALVNTDAADVPILSSVLSIVSKAITILKIKMTLTKHKKIVADLKKQLIDKENEWNTNLAASGQEYDISRKENIERILAAHESNKQKYGENTPDRLIFKAARAAKGEFEMNEEQAAILDDYTVLDEILKSKSKAEEHDLRKVIISSAHIVASVLKLIPDLNFQAAGTGAAIGASIVDKGVKLAAVAQQATRDSAANPNQSKLGMIGHAMAKKTRADLSKTTVAKREWREKQSLHIFNKTIDLAKHGDPSELQPGIKIPEKMKKDYSLQQTMLKGVDIHENKATKLANDNQPNKFMEEIYKGLIKREM